MTDLALQLIGEAKKTRNTYLDLHGCGLTELPREVFELTWLEKLYYENDYSISSPDFIPNKWKKNTLHTIPQEISKLKNLKVLVIRSAHLTNIAALAHSKNLVRLDLGSNQISDLTPLARLFLIKELTLSHNHISDIYALTDLHNLESLDLSVNKIDDLHPLRKLVNLTSLDLIHNRISNIEALSDLLDLNHLRLRDNRIKEIWPLSRLVKLSTLDLHRNSIEDLRPIKDLIARKEIWFNRKADLNGIFVGSNPLRLPPAELIDRGRAAVLYYFDELQAQGSAHLYEAKLIIIGEGGSGKTTLARKIRSESASMPEEDESTKGIAIERYQFRTSTGNLFQINIWDFGGQEVYHATHQFFITRRSLYVLVDDTRKDDKTVNDISFNYWLQVVALYGEGSPLIIVQNEKGDRSKDLDMLGIQGRFAFIKDRLTTNLLTMRGFDKVRSAIQYQIQQLPHVGQQLPTTWISIRKELEELGRLKDYISLDDYLAVCAKNEIEDEEKALQLSAYLHDLGSFLHFQDDPVLQTMFILKNDWATDAVYRVLDSEPIKKKFGRFTQNDLKLIWSDPKYKRKLNELLTLMIKFELCYELKDSQELTWLAPQLLPVEAPSINWTNEKNLVVRYTYEFMPKGMMSRFIVRMHQYVADTSLSWRTGVVLERQNTRGLVRETYGSREIVIKIAGDHAKELMTLVVEDFDRMHARFENLKVKKHIPCNCPACLALEVPNSYDYEDLMRRKERGKKTVECKNSYDDIHVVELLDGIFTKSGTNRFKTNGTEGLRVFVSYSHADEELKDKLDKHLSVLKQSNKIQVWNDRKLSGGDEWHDIIKHQLNEADVILLLISSDFMASKYIWEVEISTAIERHEKGEVQLIPIFLRDCDFEGMPFEKLQGYPNNAKSVTSFSNLDEALAQVAKGIRKSIEPV